MRSGSYATTNPSRTTSRCASIWRLDRRPGQRSEQVLELEAGREPHSSFGHLSPILRSHQLSLSSSGNGHPIILNCISLRIGGQHNDVSVGIHAWRATRPRSRDPHRPHIRITSCPFHRRRNDTFVLGPSLSTNPSHLIIVPRPVAAHNARSGAIVSTAATPSTPTALIPSKPPQLTDPTPPSASAAPTKDRRATRVPSSTAGLFR